MKTGKILLVACGISGLLATASCKKEEKDSRVLVQPAAQQYLEFRLAGFMADAPPAYRLEEARLLKVTRNAFGAKEYERLPAVRYESTKSLREIFPQGLLQEQNTHIGGDPQLTDGDRLAITYDYNGVHKSWSLSPDKYNVPPYLHPFIDETLKKMSFLNE